MTIQDRIQENGLNPTIERLMFSEEAGNQLYVKFFLQRFSGKRPYLSLACEILDKILPFSLVQEGVDYAKFDKMLLDLKQKYTEEEEEKEKQSSEAATAVACSA